MTVDRTTVTCRECGSVLQRPDVAQCPQCGSVKKQVHVEISDVIVVGNDSIRLKGKNIRLTGKKKIVLETFAGSDLEQTTGKWHEKYRLVDRRANRYRELVVDRNTGDWVHICDEPLSEHHGHGSAKGKSGRKM